MTKEGPIRPAIYSDDRAPFPRRLRIYLSIKRIELDVVNVDLMKGEHKSGSFLAKNPAGKLPVLELDDGIFLTESIAIMRYLDERFTERPMFGRTEAQRQLVDTLVGLIDDYIVGFGLSMIHTHPYLKRLYPGADRNVDLAAGPLWRGRLDQIAALLGSADCLAGDEPTAVDCMLFPALDHGRQFFGIAVPPHLKNLVAWFERFGSRSDVPSMTLPSDIHDVVLGSART